MKNLVVLILIFITASTSAQKIGGFYKGTLHNDSTKMIQNYELAIVEYRGRISGYSYVTFVANDTFYYGIRKVKGITEGDSIIVEDDKFVSNNFPESPAKKVGRTVTIPLNGQDSLVSINGRWKTNRTKNYYSVPGSVEAARSNDSSGSALFAHLRELNLMPGENNPVVQKKEKPKKEKQPGLVVETKVKVKEDKTKTETEPEKKTLPEKTEPFVLNYDQRKNNLLQTIEITSDSLLLSFYDNGVVDGDAISVYLNGESVLSNTSLKTSAIKKTIHFANKNQLNLLLVAENMGSIPPNTGLITIRDGEKIYQLNFTADMQTNASIILRRKR